MAVGFQSICVNTTGDGNTAVGYKALFCNNGSTADFNVAVGRQVLYSNTTGIRNVALGLNAMYSNTSSACNVAIGGNTGYGNTTGLKNTSVGYQALCTVSTTDNNTALGFNAILNTSGEKNTGVGSQSGTQLGSGSNNTIIGFGAQPSSGTANNEITFGDTNISAIRAQVTSITAISDKRDKSNICDLSVGLDFINDLKPVTFDWTMRDGSKKGKKDVGFIAQDLDEVQQKYNIEENLQLVLKSNPDRLEATQGKLIPLLVNAIKELTARVEELENE